MELGSIANRVSTQASAQRSAQMSLVLPRKTLELQALHITGPAGAVGCANQGAERSAASGQQHRCNGLIRPAEVRVPVGHLPD
ncbi:putative motility protein [Pseudomonas sp. SP16.1]|uniref:putative motility protein n=1 Tax=Pseudomonas sp. SP16.1 TaxID=3458854 RepID=UPI004045D9C6